MQLGLELTNLASPSYLSKILTGDTLYMAMASISFVMTCKAVVTTTVMDANLKHCLATGKSLTGCLHFELHMVQNLLLQNSNRADHGH